MAKIKASEQQTNRKKLANLIPLDTPLSMQIELASSCNFQCRFCMHHDVTVLRDKGMRLGCMSMETFKATVSGIQQFPAKVKLITLQSRGESLLNSNIVEMVQILKAADVAEKIGLYTNGTLLTQEMSSGLIEAGLDILHISIEGINSEQYWKIAKAKVNFDELVKKISYFFNNKKDTYLYIKTMDNDMTKADKDKFIEIFSGISDEIFIERAVDAWQGAEIEQNYLKKDRYGLKGKPVKICPRIFFAMVVHFDGFVVACDHDWMEQFIIGNVEEASVADMWQGEKFQELRKIHIEGKADTIERCAGCIQRTECLAEDDIDILLKSEKKD